MEVATYSSVLAPLFHTPSQKTLLMIASASVLEGRQASSNDSNLSNSPSLHIPLQSSPSSASSPVLPPTQLPHWFQFASGIDKQIKDSDFFAIT